jgi:hypothetical protein
MLVEAEVADIVPIQLRKLLVDWGVAVLVKTDQMLPELLQLQILVVVQEVAEAVVVDQMPHPSEVLESSLSHT